MPGRSVRVGCLYESMETDRLEAHVATKRRTPPLNHLIMRQGNVHLQMGVDIGCSLRICSDSEEVRNNYQQN